MTVEYKCDRCRKMFEPSSERSNVRETYNTDVMAMTTESGKRVFSWGKDEYNLCDECITKLHFLRRWVDIWFMITTDDEIDRVVVSEGPRYGNVSMQETFNERNTLIG